MANRSGVCGLPAGGGDRRVHFNGGSYDVEEHGSQLNKLSRHIGGQQEQTDMNTFAITGDWNITRGNLKQNTHWGSNYEQPIG